MNEGMKLNMDYTNSTNSTHSDSGENCETIRAALASRIDRWVMQNGKPETAIPSLLLRRWTTPSLPTSYMHEPSLCLIAQGSKRVLLGEETYQYDANHYLITTVDVPVVAQILEASPKKPYLGITLKLDINMISQLVLDGDLPQPNVQTGRGMAVSAVTPSLLHAFLRLVELLDTPADIPILAPLIQREIVYRILVGEQGARLRQIGAAGSKGYQLAKVIDWLKKNFNQPLSIEELASKANMSASSFHSHFRTLTSMSPLQYQKWLRLHEARRLMLTQKLDAATASFNVGYESPSQFSREYGRLFGVSPHKDIKQLSESTQRR